MAYFRDLPDEIILKVIYFLNIKDLVTFGHVSKRMRKISSDQSLWQKMNFSKVSPAYMIYDFGVPTDFLKMVIENGCKYLSLHYQINFGFPDLCLEKPSSLRYLDLKDFRGKEKTFEEILASCYSLQKLAIYLKSLTPNMIRCIGYQNGHTLQTLNLSYCSELDLKSIQIITKHCVELKNVDLAATRLSKDSINCLVTNLTPKIEKMDLGYLWNLKDEHLKVLVARCNKLSVLNLRNTSITNDSLTHIIENLQHTLEKLNVDIPYGIITYVKLTELKSMPKLNSLKFRGNNHEKEDLKNIMPLVKFDEKITADERKLLPADGIWDVKVKHLNFSSG